MCLSPPCTEEIDCRRPSRRGGCDGVERPSPVCQIWLVCTCAAASDRIVDGLIQRAQRAKNCGQEISVPLCQESPGPTKAKDGLECDMRSRDSAWFCWVSHSV